MKKIIKKLSILFASFAMAMGIGLANDDTHVVKAATKVTSVSNIVSGKQYYIGATVSGSDYYLNAPGTSIGTGKAGTAKTNKADATLFILEGSGTSWALKYENGNYLSLASGKANGKYNVVASASNFTVSDKTNCMEFSLGNYAIQLNTGTKTQFGSYGKTQADIWLEENSVPMQSITIKDESNNPLSSIDVTVDDTYKIIVECTPDNASNKTLTWTTSDDTVAEYSSDATGEYIYAYKEGTATITATANDGSNVSASLEVNVKAAGAPQLTGITVSGTPTKTTQYVGNEFNYSGLIFTPTYDKENTNPEEITGADITWPTLVAGMTEIVGKYHGTIDVTVTGVTVKEDTITSIVLSGDMTNKSYTTSDSWDPTGLVVTANYESGEQKEVSENISWAFSKTIVETGAGENKTVDVQVTVNGKTSNSITITGISIAVRVTKMADIVSGQRYIIGATISSGTYYFKASDITSTTAKDGGSTSNKDDATVVTLIGSNDTWAIKFENGNYLSFDGISSNAKYKVSTEVSNFTVTDKTDKNNMEFLQGSYALQLNNSSSTKFGSYKQTQTNIWLEPSNKDSVSLDMSSAELRLGSEDNNTVQLHATVLPLDKEVRWESSNESVATVNNGLVTAVGVGTAKITAVTIDTNVRSNECVITVKEALVLDHAGTEADPYSVADAIKVATDAGTNTTKDFFVTGIVSRTEDKKIYITDPSRAVEELLLYSIKDASGNNLTATNYVEGDKITACGPLVMYTDKNGTTTPEMNTGTLKAVEYVDVTNFITSWKALRDESGSICGNLASEKRAALQALIDEYDGYTIEEKKTQIANTLEDDGVTKIGTTIDYLRAVLKGEIKTTEDFGITPTESASNILTEVKDSSSIVILVAVLGVIAISAYYFVEKRRLAK